jgi:hypothetical protein
MSNEEQPKEQQEEQPKKGRLIKVEIKEDPVEVKENMG